MNLRSPTSTYLDSLARTIAEIEPNVKDYLEVSVILEVLGVNDDTAKIHGYENLFALARDVEPLVELYRGPSETTMPMRPAPPSMERMRDIDRTTTGIALLLVGALLGWIPFIIIAAIGGILSIAGAILLFLGRNTFGRTYADNVIVGTGLLIVGFLGTIVLVIGSFRSSLAFAIGATPPEAFLEALKDSLSGVFLLGAVAGLAAVLLTYGLQRRDGRILLWLAYGLNLLLSFASVWFVTQAPTLEAFLALERPLLLVGVLGLVPAALFAGAYYRAYVRVRRGDLPAPEPAAPPIGAPPRSSAVLFFTGLFYNLWWVIMLVALFLGGQSLWASVRLPPEIATSIGLGVILGLVATGGLQQFASWKMTYYLLQDNKPLARFVVDNCLYWGGLALFVVGAGYAVLNELVFPRAFGVTLITLYYFLLIGLFRLLVVPVYALKRYLPLFLSAIIALAFMFVSLRIFEMLPVSRTLATVASQSFGLYALIAVSALFLYEYVYREPKLAPSAEEPPFYSRPERPRHVRPPRFAYLAHDGLPLIAYGTLFFVYLFTDRLVSWWTQPGGLEYNAAYQIGVDMALLMLIPLTGVKFIFIYRLSDSMRETLRRIPVTRPQTFDRWLTSFYSRMMAAVFFAGLLFLGAGLFLSERIIAFAGGNETSLLVFRWALFGVFFFSVFLANAVFSLVFRRTWGLSSILLIGSIANFIIGSTLSTSASPWMAVFGFVITAVYLGAASIGYVYTYTGRADYAHYTAM